MNTHLAAALAAASLLVLAPSASACDSCGCYAPSAGMHASADAPGPFVSLAEQYTFFGTLQDDGDKVDNPTNQYMRSSITQVVVGYHFRNRLGIQLNIPVISRTFRRPEGFTIDHGSESGLGDVAILGTFCAYQGEGKTSASTLTMMFGVKTPTGSSDRIAEELNEVEIPGAPESGIHGHDLALGSGSWDALVGLDWRYRRGHFLFDASGRASLRTEGDFDYRYANEYSASIAPGGLFFDGKTTQWALQGLLAADHKGTDTFDGAKAEDTGIDDLFVGPKLVVHHGDRFAADLSIELPLWIDNTALQAVADWRAHASVTWRLGRRAAPTMEPMPEMAPSPSSPP